MGKKILVVDDEQPIVTLLSYNLEKAGFQVVAAYDGEEALEKVAFEQPALIILDLMLPKLDGVEVCKRLRQQQIMTPILMLTARDDEFDKVLGLELGADDYMTKPFSPREVVARVKAILRRTDLAQPAAEPSERLVIGDLEIFPERYEAAVGDKPLELTPKEFELLLHLARHKGRVLTRDQLLSAVWNYDFAGDTRIVDVHISHLREKIEEDTKKPVYIKTVRGLGYKLEEPRRV
ncbi:MULTISPECIES: response regulator transcription factor [Geobacillus]|mgnify:FL=1|jgi:two-component system, OmpR family, alkaline phosphatase synthesis response regulator PhoP|uniref:Two-component response regulator n=2 Tax=Geobacillus thermodenitrificans TaxID=33940 RepID=A4IRP7_GEOTN|nr:MULTISPECIES: response regulator transcription factor [Geobacillus]ABO68001.1 Two-component response regulator [Geobacillus thermodenitrificans NG80-2]ARA98838.1 DNA-binding response regulator [Geobacillus thermodenitrificans]ARP43748.1 Transcriptional regulatory protein YycF [Geobacillus thermodenitrificans]ATO38205.1 DNA-binding response regulator [Geobacillus thermodenitrificans]KQB92296.1 Alkaline phosphatase synthesis transcriptional regulatory protein PhoP [Geobacillus sp. PA-3]